MNNIAALEALLFVHGDSLSIKTAADILKCSPEEITDLADTLSSTYEEQEDRGLRIIMHDDAIQLVTHPRTSDAIEALRESTLRDALTPAALETLAVVAYRGPLPKSEIESIRGVNCGSIIRTLLLRKLIERERNKNDKRTFLYRVSSDFLQALGIASLEELPNFEQFT